MEEWFACLAQLGILEDNSSWAKYAPIAELVESPEPYSPLILLVFNEKEYMNQPTEEDGEEDQVYELAEQG